MLTVVTSQSYRRNLKKLHRSGRFNSEKLNHVVLMLVTEEKLPEQYRDHALSGNMNMFRECHVSPDILLVYRIEKRILTLTLVDIGSHSELFG